MSMVKKSRQKVALKSRGFEENLDSDGGSESLFCLLSNKADHRGNIGENYRNAYWLY